MDTVSRSSSRPIKPPPMVDADGRLRLHGAALAAVLSSLLLTLLLAALDQTIVSTALPTIIGDLHGFDRYTWVVTVYLLTETTMVPIVGKLSDQFGRKWFLVGGVVVFLLGSMLAGTSQTMNDLILWRGFQGLGAGAILALIFTLVGDIFTPAERARWQGLFAGVFALSSVIGPSAGGWITDNTTWRWIFYINVPLGLIALFMLVTQLPANISVRSNTLTGWAAVRRVDFAGALTAAGATVCLLLGLTWGGRTYSWDSAQVIGILVAAAVLFAIFFAIERVAVEPILPLELFRNQVFAAGALLSLFVGMALFAVVIYLPLFIQAVLKQSATNSGAVITPLTLTLAIGATIVGFIISRVGRYQWLSIIGSVVLTFGIFLLTRMDTTTSLLEVTRNMIVVGIGLGMLQPVLTLSVQNAIPRARLGVGTGAVTYLRTMGQTLGTAIIGAVVSNVSADKLKQVLPAGANRLPAAALNAATDQQVLVKPAAQQALIDRATSAAIQSAQVPAGPQHDQVVAGITTQVHMLFGQIFDAGRLALASGIQQAFTVGMFVSFIIIVVTLFLKDVPLGQRAPVAQTRPQNAGTEAETGSAARGEVAPVGH